ncbi:uncharacterized protein B0I36DRAFT_316225 [Microdochium trichocladiopsis]|uniref:Uncharacterized protein n=1 Tax=Microdochium trichocladiopsis TaxID=1682393 RepID=A0A9P9BVE3_9PEZI|nr:uncharacterized protein B0I36DRAFT_316225 [Microdochium trichocladiopsis]KAH7038429.1 hypothetical protein B0I36DRAFT_316225 [Microdochium trichocladiopsis]
MCSAEPEESSMPEEERTWKVGLLFALGEGARGRLALMAEDAVLRREAVDELVREDQAEDLVGAMGSGFGAALLSWGEKYGVEIHDGDPACMEEERCDGHFSRQEVFALGITLHGMATRWRYTASWMDEMMSRCLRMKRCEACWASLGRVGSRNVLAPEVAHMVRVHASDRERGMVRWASMLLVLCAAARVLGDERLYQMADRAFRGYFPSEGAPQWGCW